MPLRQFKKPSSSLASVCKLPWMGNERGSIMVVVDPVIVAEEDQIERVRKPLNSHFLDTLAPHMREAGIKGQDCVFISACRPMTKDTFDRDSKLGNIIKEDHDLFLSAWSAVKPKLIITLGKAAARQVMNRAVKVTKVRGVAFDSPALGCPVMPCLGLAHILRVPEHIETFAADIKEAGRIVRDKFTIKEIETVKDYRWTTDLSELIETVKQYRREGKRLVLGLDTESSSFGASEFPHWYVTETKVLTVQLTPREGLSYVVPLNYPGYPVSDVTRRKLIFQLKEILEDPIVGCVGQNIKHDWLQCKVKLGIKFHIEDDTIMLVHMLNENMISKTLEDISRIYIPQMAGYKDAFERKGYDKSRMDLVPADDILAYSGADSDVVLRLRDILLPKLKADAKLWNCYSRVVLPAIRAFCNVEQEGFRINRKALGELYQKVAAHQAEQYKKLIDAIPQTIKDQFKDTGVGVKPTRKALQIAWLFEHPDGMRLKPRTFTKTGEISASSKLHFPYFVNAQPIVKTLIDYVKNQKMLETFIGKDGHYDSETGQWIAPTGFWKYIFNEYVRPSYLLHGTVTGRSSSRDPNGQNFPKRGTFAKAYRAVFEAPPGYLLVEADYSQLELRIAGILSKEPTFLSIYASGGDIHCATAAVVMGISLEAFMRLKVDDPEQFALMRYRAKAVNFGFIYGMGWRKFIVYAKTEYDIDYSEAEGKRIRAAFFGKYSAIESWHIKVKEFVRKHRYVRAPDGRIRHLPAVVVDDDGVASSAERQAINSPVQGFGSDLGLVAIALLNERIDRSKMRIIGFVHDAIICIAKIGYEMEAARLIKKTMETLPLKEWFGFEPPIPFKSEVAIGHNLAKTIELNDNWIEDKRVHSFEQIKALDAAGAAKGKLRKSPDKRHLQIAASAAQRKADRMLAIPPKHTPARLPLRKVTLGARRAA
jgi:DNA polymerase I-like protein with 3'-5' exonuclease and polymerase domains